MLLVIASTSAPDQVVNAMKPVGRRQTEEREQGHHNKAIYLLHGRPRNGAGLALMGTLPGRNLYCTHAKHLHHMPTSATEDSSRILCGGSTTDLGTVTRTCCVDAWYVAPSETDGGMERQLC